eukprot:3517946-Lingulodinium_polyedra.AAC.1
MARGRAADFRLNSSCKALAALSLASGIGFSIRWVPSESNPADLPSRSLVQPGGEVVFAHSSGSAGLDAPACSASGSGEHSGGFAYRPAVQQRGGTAGSDSSGMLARTAAAAGDGA